MSREAVIDAVTSYLSDQPIRGLSQVIPYPPKLTPEGDFFPWTDPNHSAGCVMFIHIESQHDVREALTGRSPTPIGLGKRVAYDLLFPCYFRSSEQKTEDVARLNNWFLDDLAKAIRADKNAGTQAVALGGDGSGVIWQWGEGSFPYGPDIDVASEFPRVLDSSQKLSQVLSHVRVSVVEQIR